MIILRLTTPQRRRRVEFYLRRWWELATDGTYSSTSFDQAAMRSLILHDYVSPKRNVTPVPIGATACAMLPKERLSKDGAAIWNRCMDRWLM